MFEEIGTDDLRLVSSRTDEQSNYFVDRQSVHYPGFDVYYDPTSRTKSLNLGGSDQQISETTKENVQPPRKSKKAVSLPNALAGGKEGSPRRMGPPVATR